MSSEIITSNDLKAILDEVLPIPTMQTLSVTLNNGWEAYDVNSVPHVYVIHKMATLTGAIKNTSTITLNATDTHVMTLPVAPPQNVMSRQSWSDGTFHVRIDSDGKVYFARASNNGGTTYPSMASGKWLPFTLSFPIA